MHRKWVWIFRIEIADDVLTFSSFCWFWGLYLLPRVLQIYGGHQNSKTEFYPKFTCVHALFKFNRMSFWQFRLFFKWTISFHLYGWCEHARNVNKNWRIVHIVWIWWEKTRQIRVFPLFWKCRKNMFLKTSDEQKWFVVHKNGNRTKQRSFDKAQWK